MTLESVDDPLSFCVMIFECRKKKRRKPPAAKKPNPGKRQSSSSLGRRGKPTEFITCGSLSNSSRMDISRSDETVI